MLAALCMLTGCQVDLGDIPVLEDRSVLGKDAGRDAQPEASVEAGPVDPCAGALRGARCSADGTRICLEGECVESTCGDGFVDATLGEECEGEGEGATQCVRCKPCTGAECDEVPPLCPGGRMPTDEVCNGVDDDCNDEVDDGIVQELYVDADGDGYGRADMVVPGCDLADGLAYRAGDCDDGDEAVHPGATEACNGVDDDCDTEVDTGCPCAPDEMLACGARDANNDLLTLGLCEPGVQLCDGGAWGPCMNATLPADEVCDGTDDEDCDGHVDEELLTTCWPDDDGDSYAALGALAVQSCVTECPSGETSREPLDTDVDCDDGDELVNPEAAESCNGVNDDCDDGTDEGVLLTFYLDADEDGYGTATMAQTACTAPAGYVAEDGDCRDDTAAIKPGVAEICDGIDNDCNGATDDGISCSCTNGSSIPCGPPDGAGGIETRGACAAGTQLCSNGVYGECMNAVYPVAESCNGVNDDCDGNTDEGYNLGASCGVGRCAGGMLECATTSTTRCSTMPSGSNNQAVSESCNGMNDDCDGATDEGVTINCWADGDNDGFAPSGAAMTTACGSCGTGRTATQPNGGNVDCNDGNASIYPGRAESCNGVNDDCDANTDEGYNLGNACGVGRCAGGMLECATSSTTRCSTMPSGSNSQAVSESCNGMNDDCDGATDEGVTINCWADGDNDGFAPSGAAMTSACGSCGTGRTATQPSAGNIDCNDGNGNVYPGRSELCNGVNDDCDANTDEGFSLGTSCGVGRCAGGMRECATTSTTRCSTMPGGSNNQAVSETCNSTNDDCDGATDEGVTVACWTDLDDDTYAPSGAAMSAACSCGTDLTNRQPTAGNIDCNDGNANIHPGASDVCNGANDDCDANTDENIAPSCINPTTLRTCTSGSLIDTPCATGTPVCTAGECVQCTFGAKRCSTTMQPQRCDAEGSWYNYTACTTSPPQICDSDAGSSTYGECIANPPYYAGNHDVALQTGTEEVYSDDMIATPVMFSEDVRLLYIGIRVPSNSSGGDVRLAIYADRTDGTYVHEPGARLALTNNVALGIGAGTREAAPTTSLNLNANTIYWVVAKVFEDVGDDVKVHRYARQTLAGWASLYSVSYHPWLPTSTPPTTFPNVTGQFTRELSLYVQVQKR